MCAEKSGEICDARGYEILGADRDPRRTQGASVSSRPSVPSVEFSEAHWTQRVVAPTGSDGMACWPEVDFEGVGNAPRHVERNAPETVNQPGVQAIKCSGSSREFTTPSTRDERHDEQSRPREAIPNRIPDHQEMRQLCQEVAKAKHGAALTLALEQAVIFSHHASPPRAARRSARCRRRSFNTMTLPVWLYAAGLAPAPVRGAARPALFVRARKSSSNPTTPRATILLLVLNFNSCGRV